MTRPFYHRTSELATLNEMTVERAAAFILVYGRRRVGKSTLLRHWAAHSGLPTFYWAATRGNSETARADLVREFWNWLHPGQGDLAPRFANWPDVFHLFGQAVGDRPTAMIIDEFPWLIEADSALPSYLQHAWDQQLGDSRIKLILSGSHISAMVKLLHADAPLYRRLTGKLLVEPFTFPEIAPFLPRYSPEKRLAVYAMLGGVPDYLLEWRDHKDLKTNIQALFLSDRSTLRGEEEVLLSDVLRRNDPDYRTVLASVAQGHRELADIATAANLPSDRTAAVLDQLIEMHLVERRIRASVPPDQHKQARYARYALADSFLQFHYRFVEPNRTLLAQENYAAVLTQITEQLRSFVGATFEQLCRDWAVAAGRAGGLPLVPDYVSSDWQTQQHQADVVAVNWRERQVLVGEVKWVGEAVSRKVLRELRERADKVVSRMSRARPAKAKPWTLHLMYFARHGLTPAAQAEAKAQRVRVMTFPDLVRDLERLARQPR